MDANPYELASYVEANLLLLLNEPGQYFMFRWGKFELGRSLVSMHTNGRPKELCSL